MKTVFTELPSLALLVTLAGYLLGVKLQKWAKSALVSPPLVAAVFVILSLWITGADNASYQDGARIVSYLLTPATVCLAIPFYRQAALLRKHPGAIAAGILSGVLASAAGVILMAWAFGMDHAQFVTLLPKSVTSAFGMIIADEYGGYPAIAAAVIILSGIVGAVMSGPLFRLFHIRSAVARGIALGASAHAIGTARALEMGPVEGAMGSLAIAICGLITVLIMPLLAAAG